MNENSTVGYKRRVLHCTAGKRDVNISKALMNNEPDVNGRTPVRPVDDSETITSICRPRVTRKDRGDIKHSTKTAKQFRAVGEASVVLFQIYPHSPGRCLYKKKINPSFLQFYK